MIECFPIFIPTKGRSAQAKTPQLLPSNSYILVIEPKDEMAYRQRFSTTSFLVLPQSDQGIGFARQFILDHARAKQLPWYWMLDDDINRFFVIRNKRCIPIDGIQALIEAQKFILKNPAIGQAALEYQQFAWNSTKPYRLNSYCDVCVAINVKNTSLINYRPIVNMKEDRDFTLQVLASGYTSLRICAYAFSTPKNGSNQGGLSPLYNGGGHEEWASRKMAELWPGICIFHRKKDGRPDVKINWRRLNKTTPQS